MSTHAGMASLVRHLDTLKPETKAKADSRTRIPVYTKSDKLSGP